MPKDHPDWHMVQPHQGIRSDRYKLIHFYTTNEWELFDLKNDPDEMYNVYNVSEYSQVFADLTKRLEREKNNLGDTLRIKATSSYHR